MAAHNHNLLNSEKPEFLNVLWATQHTSMPQAEVNGTEIYYEVSGREDATPMVLQGHSHKPWLLQVLYFSDYYKVITFDRRGTGFSEDPPGQWTMEDLAEDMHGLLEHLDVDEAIIGGWSAGGNIACQFALDNPSMVKALLLGGSLPYRNELVKEWYDEMIETRTRLDHQPRSNDWEEKGERPHYNPEMDSWPLGSYINNQLEESRKKGRTEEQRMDNWVKLLEILRDWDVRERQSELEELGEDTPVLLFYGSNEVPNEIQLGFEWHKMIPNSEFILMEGLYHGASREDPEQFNSIIHSFLKRHGL